MVIYWFLQWAVNWLLCRLLLSWQHCANIVNLFLMPLNNYSPVLIFTIVHLNKRITQFCSNTTLESLDVSSVCIPVDVFTLITRHLTCSLLRGWCGSEPYTAIQSGRFNRWILFIYSYCKFIIIYRLQIGWRFKICFSSFHKLSCDLHPLSRVLTFFSYRQIRKPL